MDQDRSSSKRVLVATAGIAALASGCGAERGARDDGATVTSPLSVGSSVTADGSGEVSESLGSDSLDADGDTADDGIVLDVGSHQDGSASAEGGDASGCEKVDFLFVIDNSGSMGDEQTALISSFPGFMNTIQATLDEAQDYHVMVVDTDAEWGGECVILCDFFGGVCPDIAEYPCATGAPSECDTVLGAGVTYPMGDDATNQLCTFSSGARWMDASEPDLSASFQCAAHLGSSGDGNEKPMSSMVSALSEQLTAPGGCNEGFVRDDAILVITIITDEEDNGSTGVPEGWFANVIASKGGDASAIVMLGLVNDPDVPAPVCPPETEDPVKLRTFLDMFPNVIRGSVCEPNYNGFFDEAVALIDNTCDEFEPPG
jgi:hypothetical protein